MPRVVLAFAAHPDDAELGCGATLAAFAASGGQAVIVDLTGGERASRGTKEERWAEAQEAAKALGVERLGLELPDTALDAASDVQRRAVVQAIRTFKPAFVLLPHPDDPHPDHRQASLLVQAATFLAGVHGFARDLGAAFRPALLLAYPGPRQVGEPTVVVDVSASYGKKRHALAAYRSQFGAGETATHLASGYFLAAIEGRDRAYGNTVGVEFGEGLFALGPVSGEALAAFLAEVSCASA